VPSRLTDFVRYVLIDLLGASCGKVSCGSVGSSSSAGAVHMMVDQPRGASDLRVHNAGKESRGDPWTFGGLHGTGGQGGKKHNTTSILSAYKRPKQTSPNTVSPPLGRRLGVPLGLPQPNGRIHPPPLVVTNWARQSDNAARRLHTPRELLLPASASDHEDPKATRGLAGPSPPASCPNPP